MQQEKKQPTVVCSGIMKSFGAEGNKVTALSGIDLKVEAGELMMLVGPSGCGKTTLISIIAGILKPDRGSCKILGRDWEQLRGDEATEFRGKNIGFIFQSYNLLPALTLVENVAVPLVIGGVAHASATKQATEILKEVGLGERLHFKPSQLSGGQQQRVAIARAMVHQPQVLVCDEPTSALDHKTGAHVMELIRRAAKDRGATLIIITHDNRILDYADRIAHMDDGRIVDGSAVAHH